MLAGAGAVVATGASVAGSPRFLKDTTADFEYVSTTISSPAIPRSLNGFQFGFLTDIHYGATFAREWIVDIVTALNREKLDLILLGGDYLWIPESTLSRTVLEVRNREFARATSLSFVRPLYHALAQEVGLLRSRLGTFAILGNHDRWLSAGVCASELKQQGITLLVNQGIRFEQAPALELFGVDDYWNGIPRIPEPYTTIDDSVYRIFLCHNPDFLDGASKILPYHLAACGHTHGGQIQLPVLGALTYNISDSRYQTGLHQNGDLQHVYTSRGLGHVEIPFRINCRPEVSLFELRSI